MQIANLQLQLQAQTSRASLLQTRLTAVMDNMDALRNQHRQELKYHTEGEESLQTKLDRLLEYTGQVEAERDESKECLLAVFSKGELRFPLCHTCGSHSISVAPNTHGYFQSNRQMIYRRGHTPVYLCPSPSVRHLIRT